MKRSILIFCIFLEYIWSINLDIVKDDNISVNEKDVINTISRVYKNNRIKLTKEAAKTYSLENRILANKYIEKHKKIPEFIYYKIKLDIEEKLAKAYIDEYLKHVHINNQILKSYYVSHPKKFYKDATFEIMDYREKTFNKALKTYNILQKTHIKHKNILKNKLKGEKILLSARYIPHFLRKLFQQLKEGDMTPPIYLKDGYHVFVLLDKKEGKRKKFEEVKKEIKNILLHKIYIKKRKELVKN